MRGRIAVQGNFFLLQLCLVAAKSRQFVVATSILPCSDAATMQYFAANMRQTCSDFAANLQQPNSKIVANLQQTCGKLAAKVRQTCSKVTTILLQFWRQT
jgi:hypothetical protein